MKSSVFFWGAFLIFLGIFLLMNNFGILNFQFDEIFDWWPIILVILGVALLKLPDIVRHLLMALSGILLSLFIVALISNGLNFFDDIRANIEFSEDEDNCTKYFESSKTDYKIAKLNFSGGAGHFSFGSTDDNLYYLTSGYNNCDVDTDEPNDSTIIINYTFGDSESINTTSARYSKLLLLDGPVWDIDISAGASKLDLDFSNLRVNKIKIDAGASNATLKLSADMPMTKVSINCGAATLNIEVPENAGCSVQGDMALSKINFIGLNQNSSGTYISDNYYKSNNKIDFYIDGAISTIKIVRIQNQN
jgi:hypothetical protein